MRWLGGGGMHGIAYSSQSVIAGSGGGGIWQRTSSASCAAVVRKVHPQRASVDFVAAEVAHRALRGDGVVELAEAIALRLACLPIVHQPIPDIRQEDRNQEGGEGILRMRFLKEAGSSQLRPAAAALGAPATSIAGRPPD